MMTETIEASELRRGDLARFIYPDGAVLVGRMEQDPPTTRPAPGDMLIVTLFVQQPALMGRLPVDISGAIIERVSEND